MNDYKVCVSFKCDLTDNEHSIVIAFVSSYIKELDECPVDKQGLMSVLTQKVDSRTINKDDIELICLSYLLMCDEYADRIRNATDHIYILFHVELSDDYDGSAAVNICELDRNNYKEHINNVRQLAYNNKQYH